MNEELHDALNQINNRLVDKQCDLAALKEETKKQIKELQEKLNTANATLDTVCADIVRIDQALNGLYVAHNIMNDMEDYDGSDN